MLNVAVHVTANLSTVPYPPFSYLLFSLNLARIQPNYGVL